MRWPSRSRLSIIAGSSDSMWRENGNAGSCQLDPTYIENRLLPSLFSAWRGSFPILMPLLVIVFNRLDLVRARRYKVPKRLDKFLTKLLSRRCLVERLREFMSPWTDTKDCYPFSMPISHCFFFLRSRSRRVYLQPPHCLPELLLSDRIIWKPY